MPELKSSIAEQLRRTVKYRCVCEDTLSRIAAWAEVRHASPKEALKAAKRKLHQIYGAYFDRVDFADMERLVAALPTLPNDAALYDTCKPLLRSHASTRERMGFMEEAFADVFSKTGMPNSVLDLACGLMPFALPWLHLPLSTRYEAWDIDSRLTANVNAFLQRIGRPATAYCRDILVSAPSDHARVSPPLKGGRGDVAFYSAAECSGSTTSSLPPFKGGLCEKTSPDLRKDVLSVGARGGADLVLLLKTAPCIEQQETGATLRLLRQLRARYVLLSFPTKSLGGREKGMLRHYGKFVDDLANALHVSCDSRVYSTEVFYLFTFRV